MAGTGGAGAVKLRMVRIPSTYSARERTSKRVGHLNHNNSKLPSWNLFSVPLNVLVMFFFKQEAVGCSRRLDHLGGNVADAASWSVKV